MKKSYLFIGLLILFFTNAKTQNCSQFANPIIGDLSNPNIGAYDNLDGDMLFDTYNNIYTTGYGSYFLNRYSKNGTLKWNKIKSGKFAVELEVYNNNVIYVTGKDVLLCKFDSSGNELFTPVNITNTQPSSMCLDNSGNVYITGLITGNAVFGTNTYSQGYFIAKFNSSGQLNWSKNISCSNGNLSPTDLPTIISDGSFLYIANNLTSTTSTVSLNVGLTSVMTGTGSVIIKSDLNGNVKWVKKIPITVNASQYPNIYDMAFNNAGKIIAGCYSKCVLIDTTGTINNYYFNGAAWNKITHIKTFNNKFCGISKTSADFMLVGDVQNSAAEFFTVFTPNSTLNKVYLANFDKNGILHAAFPNLPSSSSVNGIDLATVTNTISNATLIKYNSDHKFLPTYTSKSLTCGDDSVQLGYPTYSAFPGYFTPTTFNWVPSTALSSTIIQNPKSKPATSIVYTVTVNGTCPNTVSVNVNNASDFTYTTNNMVATFSITGTGCNTFLWDFGNGNTSSINPNPVITYASTGTYGVCLQCNGQPTNCVKCINVTVPSNIGNGVGIEEFEEKLGIKIYPIPSNGFLFIELKEARKTEVILYNTIGQQVLNKMIQDKSSEIDLSNLPNGIYTAHIKNENGTKTQKIILYSQK